MYVPYRRYLSDVGFEPVRMGQCHLALRCMSSLPTVLLFAIFDASTAFGNVLCSKTSCQDRSCSCANRPISGILHGCLRVWMGVLLINNH